MRRSLSMMLGLALCALAGCPVNNKTAAPAGSGQAAAKTVQPGGTLRLPLSIAPDDPALKNLDFSDHRLFALARAVGVPLLNSDESGQLLPGLADMGRSISAGTVWQFAFDSQAEKIDPEPNYRAQVWVRNIERLLHGEPGPLQAQLSDLIAGAADFRDGKALTISGIKLEGDDLTIALTRPDAVFGLWLSQPGLSVLESTSFPTKGFSPFFIDSLAGNVLKLKPNPDSFFGQPLLAELDFICEPDPVKQLAMFRAGELDAANISVADAAFADDDAQLKAALVHHETAASVVGFFDMHEFPWGEGEFQSSLGLRQAANWGLEREEFLDSQNSQLMPWPHFLPRTFERYIDPQSLTKPPFPLHSEIQLARDGLIRSDHDQGVKLPQGMDIMYITGEQLDSLATDMLQYLEEISIKMRPFAASRDDLAKRLDLGTNEIILARLYPAYPDVDALFYPALSSALYGRGGNWSMLKDKKVDAALAQGQAATSDGERLVIYRQLSRELEERALALFIGYSTPDLLISPRLAGCSLTPYDFDASLPAQDFAKLGFAAEQ